MPLFRGRSPTFGAIRLLETGLQPGDEQQGRWNG